MKYFSLSFNFNTPTKIVILFSACLLLIGIGVTLTSFLPRPTRKVKKTIHAFNKRNKSKDNTRTFDGGLTTLAKRFAPYVKLNALDHSELTKALQITGNPMTAEEYRALCYVSASIFIIMGLLMFGVGALMDFMIFTIFGVIGIAFGVFYYFVLKKSIMKDRDNIVGGVDKELPRFVSFMSTALQKQNGSILSIIERYTPHDITFASEIEQTIADAKTSNFDGAMARWDQRMNSDRLKRVIRGLINANNGDDVRVYFAMLERDFNAYEMTMLKQNIKTIPDRMKLPKMLMYSSVALTLFFPILMQVIESFSLFFNAS